MTDFDDYQGTYQEAVERSIAFSGQDLDYFTMVKADALLSLARREIGDPAGLRMLDVGCGAGQTDRFLTGRVGELHGVDVSEGLIEDARLLNPSVQYQSYDGGRLPYRDGEMDMAFAICVVHHVPPKDWFRFAEEMARVVRPGGVMVFFEHNPLNPLTRLAVVRCPFDEDARLLGRWKATQLMRAARTDIVERRYILFSPAGGDRLAPLERRLGWLPLGAQYYVAGRVR